MQPFRFTQDGVEYDFNPLPEQAAQAAEQAVEQAHEDVYTALSKLGIPPEALALVLCVEPRAVREAKAKAVQQAQDKLRKDWEDGQKFDKAERERREPTPVAPTDPAKGWSATWEKKTATTLELAITNASGVKAVAYRETSSNGKVLTTGSRTVGAAPLVDTYNYSKGWPFDTLNVTLRIGHPVTGTVVPVTRK